MLKEVFSDHFAQKDNFLTKIDARIKLFFVAAAIALSLGATRWFLPLCISGMCIWALMKIKIPKRVILMRLCAPLGFTMVVVLIQIFFYGSTPLFRLHLFGVTLVGYSEGLLRGLLIFSRVMAAVSLIIFFSMTTPLVKILAAARFFKVPSTWIEITALTYRYIFMLFEDIVTIRDAQRVRLGYSSIKRSMYSIGELAGAAVIKAYDQSLAIQEAMQARGGRERLVEFEGSEKFTRNDWLAAGVFGGIFVLLLIISIR